MRSIATDIRAALRRLEDDLLEGDVSASETLLLALLHEQGGSLPSELAEELALSRGRLSHLLRRLEGRGWIHFTELERDRRAKRIELSPDGRGEGERAAIRLRLLESRVRRELGGAEEGLLRQMLRAISLISED